MTEAEWQACVNPRLMLEFIRSTASDRRMRLFAVACCRSVWHLLKDEEGKEAVEVAEGYVDGVGTSDEMIRAYVETNHLIQVYRARSRNIHKDAMAFALLAVLRSVSGGWCFYGQDWEYDSFDPLQCASDAAEYVEIGSAWAQKGSTFRDIFGNPFRPVTFHPEWRTSTVLALAQQMYDARDFTAMPILADALQDSGCENSDILPHCRQPGEHVRGCWLVDLVLDKV
jgi:hypothetical protein